MRNERIIYLALVFLFTLYACTSPEKEFNKAAQVNTIEAFESFMEKNKGSKFEEEAKNKIKSLMGKITFTFIDKQTKKNIGLTPALFFIYDEHYQNGGKKTKQDSLHTKYNIEVKSEGNGYYLITNIFPGRYVLAAISRKYGAYPVSTNSFTISEGKSIDLGNVEVNMKDF